MKAVKAITIIIFSLVLLLPLVTFNFEEGAISEIDNRALQDNPLTAEGDLTENVDNYISDRIGFRDEMILSYTVLNDTLFNKMVHPSYSYGKDGYVFGAGVTTVTYSQYTEYHEAFADMVAEVQKYCDERSVPFLFVFNPAKPAVYSEHLADGINYGRVWVDELFSALDERGVNYLDNTETLIEAKNAGNAVFNRKYDANHWNYLGAYYGTNAILKKLSEAVSGVYINTLDDLVIEQELQTTLMVSKFPINENVPKITVNSSAVNNTASFSAELRTHSSYRTIGCYENSQRRSEGAPRALVFQGSYMNGYGAEYLANAFSEYVHIHDYQNIMDIPYYFNIFTPDCVVFEVAEYTFSDTYFDFERMSDFNLPVAYSDEIKNSDSHVRQTLSAENVSVERGETLTKIVWNNSDTASAAWLIADREYDMSPTDGGWEVTVLNEVYDSWNGSFEIATV